MPEKIRKFLQELRKEFLTYPLDKKFYLVGNVILWYFFVPIMIICFFGKKTFPEQAIYMISYFIGSIFCVGVYIESWKIVADLFRKTYIKWLVGGVSLLVYKFSVVQADKYINVLTGLEPSYLPSASSALSTFYLLYCWLIATAVILSLILLIAIIFVFVSSIKKNNLSAAFWFARFFGMSSTCIILFHCISFFENSDPKSFVATVSKEIILGTEYFSYSHCKNIRKDQIVADIGGGYVSAFDKNNDIFYVIKCEVNEYSKRRVR